MQNLCFIFNIYNRSPEQPPHTTHLDGLDRLLIEHKISIYSLDQFNFFLSCHLYEFLFVVCQKFDFFCIRSTPPPLQTIARQSISMWEGVSARPVLHFPLRHWLFSIWFVVPTTHTKNNRFSSAFHFSPIFTSFHSSKRWKYLS